MSGSQGFDDLARDLGRAPASVVKGIGPILRRTALEVKRGMVEDFQKSRHFRQVARSIDYDVTTTGAFGSHVVQAEIGPNAARHRSAALAGIAYFGGANGGGGTVRDPSHHLQVQGELMEKYIGDLLEEAL